MNETAANPPIPETRRRLIRRSLRCEMLGWVGLIPVLGAGVAFVAVQLHRQTLRDAGEQHPQVKTWTALTLGAPLSAAVAAYESTASGIVMATLFLLLTFHHLQLQSVSAAACAALKPARRQLFRGGALAYAGLFVSATLLLTGTLVVLRAYH